jgi:hypothetical protein
MVTERFTIRELEVGEDAAVESGYLCEISHDERGELFDLELPFGDRDEEELRWFLESFQTDRFRPLEWMRSRENCIVMLVRSPPSLQVSIYSGLPPMKMPILNSGSSLLQNGHA